MIDFTYSFSFFFFLLLKRERERELDFDGLMHEGLYWEGGIAMDFRAQKNKENKKTIITSIKLIRLPPHKCMHGARLCRPLVQIH